MVYLTDPQGGCQGLLLWDIGQCTCKMQTADSRLQTRCKMQTTDYDFFSIYLQVNPDNSQAMSVLPFSLFKLNTLQTKIVKL